MPTRSSRKRPSAVTAKQLALARELARRWKLDLSKEHEGDLAFLRAFLDAFALSADNPFEQVLRRLRNARQLAWDGLTGEEIARKLELPACLGAVLHAYGLAQVPRRWRSEGSDGEPPVLDRATELVLEERDPAAELGVSSP